MDIKKTLDLFIKQFPEIPIEILEEFLTEGEIITLKKKEFFSRSGDIDQRIGVVLKGIFRGFFIKDGDEISPWFSSEYDIIASYMGILSKSPSRLTYQALEDSEVYILNYEKIKLKAKTNIVLMELLIRILETQLLESYLRIERYILLNPEERFKLLLEKKPEIFNRVSQRMLASYVGVTPVSLSRIKARLTPRKRG